MILFIGKCQFNILILVFTPLKKQKHKGLDFEIETSKRNQLNI